ncbi:acyltransferase family protein [Coraliomargarita sp. W4R72]
MRYHSIDIIRGFAALSVVISHLLAYLLVDLSNLFDRACQLYLSIFEWVFSNTVQGSVHPGVIMFIVLSGFCIHLPIAGAYERIEASGYWWQYAVRRLVRIVPVYWLACLLGVITLLIWQFASADLSWPNWLYSDTSIGLSAIFRKFLMLDPLLPVGPVGLGNPAIRTVATEVVLYALYPGVLFILLKTGWLGRAITLLVLYVATVGLGALPMGSAWAYESVPRFLVWWSIGACAADFYKNQKKWGSSRSGWWLTAALGVVMCLAIHMPILGLYSLWLTNSSMADTVMFADTLLIPLCLIFVATEFCYRYVELPSHHIAKKLGQKVLVRANSSSCSK